MTAEFIELFNNSGLTKSEFCKILGMYNQNLNRYLNKDVSMSVAYYTMYKIRYEDYLKTL
jgi:hypothetical protein